MKKILSEVTTESASDIAPFIFRVLAEAIFEIKRKYADNLPQKFLISNDRFETTKVKLYNDRGQIYAKQSENTLLNDQQPVFAYGN